MSVNNTAKFHDKNETLEVPKGFAFLRVGAFGAFLAIDYKLKRPSPFLSEYVTIFLNDQGREVGRTSWTEIAEPPPQQQIVPSEPDPEFTVDWSGIGSSHIKAPNKFVAYLNLWWQCFCGVIKRRKS